MPNISRRNLLAGLLAAPAVVAFDRLMPVKALAFAPTLHRHVFVTSNPEFFIGGGHPFTVRSMSEALASVAPDGSILARDYFGNWFDPAKAPAGMSAANPLRISVRNSDIQGCIYIPTGAHLDMSDCLIRGTTFAAPLRPQLPG